MLVIVDDVEKVASTSSFRAIFLNFTPNQITNNNGMVYG
jgi:hypothetical protein